MRCRGRRRRKGRHSSNRQERAGSFYRTWIATRANTSMAFDPPQLLPAPVNEGGANDVASWISPDGTRLYLSSDRAGSSGQDINLAVRIGGGFDTHAIVGRSRYSMLGYALDESCAHLIDRGQAHDGCGAPRSRPEVTGTRRSAIRGAPRRTDAPASCSTRTQSSSARGTRRRWPCRPSAR